MAWNPVRVTALANGAWGMLWAGAGIGHSIAVWNTAFSERSGLDNRLATLLAIGWAMLAVGATLAASAWATWKGRSGALTVSCFALAYLLVHATILAFIAGPIGIAGNALLLAWTLVVRQRTRPAAGRQY